jgi:cbb3-type cytochrome oxidase maturation protein
MDGMDILYLLVPLSIVLVFLIGAGFWWSLKSGQFDDLDGPGYRILMDDDRAREADAAGATKEKFPPQ